MILCVENPEGSAKIEALKPGPYFQGTPRQGGGQCKWVCMCEYCGRSVSQRRRCFNWAHVEYVGVLTGDCRMDAWGRGEGGHFRQRRIHARRCGCDMAGAVMSCQCDCTEVCGAVWERGQGGEQGPITDALISRQRLAEVQSPGLWVQCLDQLHDHAWCLSFLRGLWSCKCIHLTFVEVARSHH